MAQLRLRSRIPSTARLFDTLTLGTVLTIHGGIVLAMSGNGHEETRIQPAQVLQVAWLGSEASTQSSKTEAPKTERVKPRPSPQKTARATKSRPVRLLSTSLGDTSSPAPEPRQETETAPNTEKPVQTEPAHAVRGEGVMASRATASHEKEAAETPASFSADYLNNPAPTYPRLSRSLREQGRVLLRVRVSANGLAEEVDLHRSSGFARLDEAAQQAVRGWRFVPAKHGKEAIPSWVVVPIEFTLRG